MKVKVMTSKDLHLAVKRCDGITYLIERFGFADEEELFDVIRRVTPSHSEKFIKELRNSRRKPPKVTVTNFESEDAVDIVATNFESEDTADIVATNFESEDTTDIIATNFESEQTSNVFDEEPIPEEENEDVKKEDKSMQMEELLKEEQELSASLCILEGLHKEMVSTRRDIVSSLVAEKKYLLELRKEMAEHEQKVKELYQKYEACYTKMEKLNGDMRACENLLIELRAQIAELKKIVILVYDTGVIELENAEMPLVSDETVKCEFDRLISLTEAENVTIKNVKSVAKLRAMMRELPGDTEIIFDSPEVQALYEAA